MYAFGDDAEPLTESVHVLDEIVTEYIVDMASGQQIQKNQRLLTLGTSAMTPRGWRPKPAETK